jgi:hypothetical protein
MKHNSLGLGDIHRLANWEYATAVARLAANGFTADDIGKIAKQTDNNTFWELTAVTPAWLQIGGGSNIQLDIDIGTEAGDEIEIALQLQDSSGNNITSGNYALHTWLSDDVSSSFDFTSNLPDAILGINGTEIITSVYWITPFIDGVATISIQETSAETWYLCIQMPDGTVTISNEITFA